MPSSSTSAGACTHLLVAAQLKGTDATPTLSEHLGNYVKDTYGESTYADIVDDINDVCSMREQVRCFSNSNSTEGGGSGSTMPDGQETEKVDLCLKYYKSITMMESRFPLGVKLDKAERNRGKLTDHLKKVSFSWWDSYRPGKKCAQASFLFEKASVLFNAGALSMQMGLSERSKNEELGMKVACKSFQTAAGYFLYLKDNIVPRLISGQGAYSNGTGSGVLTTLSNINNNYITTTDLSRESCVMLELLCLGQAQECFYELAIKNAKAKTIISKLAKYSGLLYADAHAVAINAPLTGHIDKSWAAYLMAKGKLFDALSYKFLAADDRDNERIGEEIARLQAAEACIKTALQQKKILNASLANVLVDIEAEIQRDFKKAHRENDTIYLARIPSLDSLQAPTSVSMVKSDVDGVAKALDAKGMKLFEKLVPDVSAKALSKYTEMVDELVRGELTKLENESDNARLKLRQYDLPDVLFSIEGGGNSGTIPSPLCEQIESLEKEGGVRQIKTLLEQIQSLSSLNREMIESIKRTLDDEESADNAMRDQFEAKWSATESKQLNKGFRSKIFEYEKGCSAADVSDQTLQKRFGNLEPHFSSLTVKGMSKLVPMLRKPLVATSCASQLKDSVVELQSLGLERESVEESLQEIKSSDNILPLIMATTQSYDSLFCDELKKYSLAQTKVASLIERQSKLVTEMETLYMEFKREFDLDAWRKECESFVEQSKELIDTFIMMRDNLNEGLRFHTAQQDAIACLQRQCEDFTATRKIQRNEIVEKIQTSALNAYASRQNDSHDLNSSFSLMDMGHQNIDTIASPSLQRVASIANERDGDSFPVSTDAPSQPAPILSTVSAPPATAPMAPRTQHAPPVPQASPTPQSPPAPAAPVAPVAPATLGSQPQPASAPSAASPQLQSLSVPMMNPANNDNYAMMPQTRLQQMAPPQQMAQVTHGAPTPFHVGQQQRQTIAPPPSFHGHHTSIQYQPPAPPQQPVPQHPQYQQQPQYFQQQSQYHQIAHDQQLQYYQQPPAQSYPNQQYSQQQYSNQVGAIAHAQGPPHQQIPYHQPSQFSHQYPH